MPVWDISRVAVIGVKVAFFAYFLDFFLGYSDEVFSVVNSALTLAFNSFGTSLPSVDLGCFLTNIGLVDFLNNILISIYLGINIFTSALATIWSFKLGLVLFRAGMTI